MTPELLRSIAREWAALASTTTRRKTIARAAALARRAPSTTGNNLIRSGHSFTETSGEGTRRRLRCPCCGTLATPPKRPGRPWKTCMQPACILLFRRLSHEYSRTGRDVDASALAYALADAAEGDTPCP